MTGYLCIPNWEDMQHYKDRSPPWIKLHNELLESYEFECLPDASKAHLLCIWLLASRTSNKIKADSRWISRKIGANTDVDLKVLIDSGFLELNQPLPSMEQDASKMHQTMEQDACLEREGEESRIEREESIKTLVASAPVDQYKSNANDQSIEVFEHWLTTMNKGSQTKPTAGRMSKIKARLKDGYTVDQIKLAIDGCKSSAHHMGKNNDGKVYDCLTLICRSAEKLDMFIGYTAAVNPDYKREQEVLDWVNEGQEKEIQGEVIDNDPF